MKADEFKIESDKFKIAISKVAQDFGLVIVKEEIDVWGVELVYQNQTSGVRCSLSPREGAGWTAIIGKLRGGSFPPHPIEIDDNTLLDRFNIRDIAAIRSDRLPPEMSQKLGDDFLSFGAEDVAKLLSHCCDDVLQGDFSSLDEASTIVKQRAKRLRIDYPRRGVS